MPRAIIDLQNSADLKSVNGVWRFAQGLVPGEPNEGLVARIAGSPARLADFDDSGWETTDDIAEWRSDGLSFIWYRINITIPETVGGHQDKASPQLIPGGLFQQRQVRRVLIARQA